MYESEQEKATLLARTNLPPVVVPVNPSLFTHTIALSFSLRTLSHTALSRELSRLKDSVKLASTLRLEG